MNIKVKILDATRFDKFIADYKNSEEYTKREKQTVFCVFARRVIGDMLKNRHNRYKWDLQDLTALINVFKHPQNADRFVEKYFERNLRKLEFPDPIHYKIMDQFRALPEEALGYTGAGLHSITMIFQDQVDVVHEFMEGLYSTKSVAEVKKIVTKYQKREIPQVTDGIFSPWAHYLHPKLCPITNTKSKKMFKAFGFSWDGDYTVAMDVFMALGKSFGIEDLGLVDRLVSSARLRAGLEKLIQLKGQVVKNEE